MKNAGVAQSVVAAFTGHGSAQMSDHYTHADILSMKRAIATLPRLRNARKTGSRSVSAANREVRNVWHTTFAAIYAPSRFLGSAPTTQSSATRQSVS
jgi:hypothetical protein